MAGLLAKVRNLSKTSSKRPISFIEILNRMVVIFWLIRKSS